MARGGRGGRVLYVTNLLDYDTSLGESVIPGSLRWALVNQTGPRNVLFKVGGTITLKNYLYVRDEPGSFLTIAGQTAPGDGVQIAGRGIMLVNDLHDVVIRHLRIRPGITPLDTWIDPDGAGPMPPYVDKVYTDALTVCGDYNAQLGRLMTVTDVMVDHCSLGWSIDENVNPWDGVRRLTIQHSIICEGSLHGHYGNDEPYPYLHSMGLIAGGPHSPNVDDYLTLHHNLFTGNRDRNPLLACKGSLVHMVNNLIYNWGIYATYLDGFGADSPSTRVNIIGNRYIQGPTTVSRYRRPVGMTVCRPDDPTCDPAREIRDATVYVRDNIGPGREDDSVDDWAVVFDGRADMNELDPVNNPSDQVLLAKMAAKRRSEMWPVSGVPVTEESVWTVLESVTQGAGATRPVRDSMDQRLIEEVLSGTGRNGFGTREAYDTHPILAGGVPPADNDGDGMPDAWETVQGLNPDDASDGVLDPDGDGYTNLEEYLNELAGDE